MPRRAGRREWLFACRLYAIYVRNNEYQRNVLVRTERRADVETVTRLARDPVLVSTYECLDEFEERVAVKGLPKNLASWL